MRPNDVLIRAWREYLHTHQKGEAACKKARIMYEYSVRKAGVDLELRTRADELHKQGRRFKAHALALFRKALAAAYDKRYRMVWRDYHTCTVWVHERYKQEETPLCFNTSLRCRKHLH